MKKLNYLLIFLILLFMSCKKKNFSRLKANSCLKALKSEIPLNIKNKIYWENKDYAISLGIEYDTGRGTYALASGNAEKSNMSVYLMPKNRTDKKKSVCNQTKG